MGAFYNTVCIPGDEHPQVRCALERWLCARGFELTAETVLFDLDGETERCAFLVWNERWTLLFFSKYEEERRLIRELRTAAPLLYVWVQDSDVWGYDLFDENGFAGSFSSDPKTYRSFDEDRGERPDADPDDLCRRLGLGDRGAELRRIQRLRPVFKEDACFELCRLIGAEPALTGYDDLESGDLTPPEGWNVEQLFFVHRAATAADRQAPDLHEVSLGGGWDHPGSRRRSAPIEIPPEVLAEAERRRRRTRFLVVLLRPLTWLARTLRGAYEAPARARQRPRSPRPPAALRHPKAESSDVIEVRHLINERHRCRIRLAVGGEARSGSSKPASVFAFQIGGTAVTCTARRRSRIGEVLQQPSRSTVLRDDKYLIGGLKARHVVFELPPYYLAGTSGPSYLGLHVVQTEAALYVFLYRFPREILKAVERAISATVRSFRLLT